MALGSRRTTKQRIASRKNLAKARKMRWETGDFTPIKGFKPPDSIEEYRARIVPGSDRSQGTQRPSKVLAERIRLITEDIALNGDASRSGGGEKAKRVRYLRQQLRREIAAGR